MDDTSLVTQRTRHLALLPRVHRHLGPKDSQDVSAAVDTGGIKLGAIAVSDIETCSFGALGCSCRAYILVEGHGIEVWTAQSGP